MKKNIKNEKNNSFGFRLDYLIRLKGLKKWEFADKIGVSSGYISDLCKDKKLPSTRLVSSISEFFQTSPDYLLNGDPKKPNDLHYKEIQVSPIDDSDIEKYNYSIPKKLVVEELMERISELKEHIATLKQQLADKDEIITMLKSGAAPAKKPKAQGE